MNAEAIELICEKLGTTVEKLLPSVIEYETSKIHAYGFICLFVFVFSIGLICLGFTKWAYRTDLDVGFFLFGGGFFSGSIIFGIVVIYNSWLWNINPTMKAWETVLSWVASKS